MESAIIFDFDGTLHDSLHIYRRALAQGYQWLVDQDKVPPRQLTEADMAANIGLTAREAWERMCPDVPWSVTGEAAELVGQLMDEGLRAGAARLYEGVPEMLAELREDGHVLVLLSNCRSAYAQAARCGFATDRWFDAYYAAEEFGWEPKERIFEAIREQVAGPWLVVGDRDKDLALARAHGLPFIGCTYGYGAPDELEGADFLALSPAEIPGLVRRVDAAYSLSAEVRRGRGEGAGFGFATANLLVEPLLLAEGVYAAWAAVDGVRYKAAVSVGVSPTFEDAATANVEAHVLDFEGDLVGKPLSLDFAEYLRPMRKFASADELVAAVEADIRRVRSLDASGIMADGTGSSREAG